MRGLLHISLLNANQTDGETLELSTREMVNVTVLNLAEFCQILAIRRCAAQDLHTKNIEDVFHVVHLRTSLDEVANTLDGTLDSSGDLVDILRLDNSLQVILQHLCEVVYER